MKPTSSDYFFARIICTCVLLCFFLLPAQAQTSTALTFDGVDDQVNIPNPGAFDFTTGTVEAWVKPGASSANKAFISMRTSGGTRWSVHLNQSAGTIGLWNGTIFNTVSQSLQAGTWYHIALTISTANTTVYVNGLQIGTTGNGMNALVTGSPVTIGSPNDIASSGEWFAGDIDEVRIWNTILTQDQIKETIFKAPAPAASGLIAHYAFNEGSNTTLVNSSTNTASVDGTLVNGPVWADSPVIFAGNALSLGGTDDYAEVPWSPTHDIVNTLTIEAWVYPTTNDWHSIVMKGSYGYGFALSGNGGIGGCGSTDNLVFWDQSQCGSTIRSTLTYSLNTWQHVAVTVEDIGAQLRIYFYLDGVEDGPYFSGIADLDNGGVNKPLYIGTQGECFCNYFSGNIDELRIWSEIRSQGQIQAGMNTELNPASQVNLVAYYTFNQGIAEGDNTGLITVIDQKGTNNAALTNFSLNTSTSNYVIQHSGLFVLPLRWLSFTAQRKGKNVILNWSTASEKNTKDFIAQHSADGVAWKNIGMVAAVGNSSSTTNYSYLHTTPVSGINFYRIEQTDIDGRSSFSEIRSLKFSDESLPFTLLTNPATNGIIQVRVNFTGVLSLYNNDGKLIWNKQVVPGIQTFNIRGYAKSIYFLKTNNYIQKIAVQ